MSGAQRSPAAPQQRKPFLPAQIPDISPECLVKGWFSSLRPIRRGQTPGPGFLRSQTGRGWARGPGGFLRMLPPPLGFKMKSHLRAPQRVNAIFCSAKGTVCPGKTRCSCARSLVLGRPALHTAEAASSREGQERLT